MPLLPDVRRQKPAFRQILPCAFEQGAHTGHHDENLLRNRNKRFRDKEGRSLSESSRTPLTILDRARGLCPGKSEWREDAESPSDWAWSERNTAIFGNGEGACRHAESPSRQRILSHRRGSMNNAS